MSEDINEWLCFQVNLLQRPVSFQPFTVSDMNNLFIIAIYDPFKQVQINGDVLKMLEENGWMNEYTGRFNLSTQHLFDNPWIATKIFRSMFTPNFYCFRNTNEVTSVLGIIDSMKEVLEIQNWCGLLGLSSVIYSEKKIEGWKKVQITKEPWDYKKSMIKPNHLKLFHGEMKSNYSNIPKFRQFYYKMNRICTLFKTDWNSKYEELIAKLQWSWMCFLLPIAVDENSVSTLELTKHLTEELDETLKGKTSLKMILNILKCHPIQLAGTTNLVCFNHSIDGNEMCYSYFKYVYNNSIDQWILQYKNTDQKVEFREEVLKTWKYENDWIYLNDLQKMVLECLIYAEDLPEYPWNLPKIWKKNRERIQNRTVFDRGRDPNRANLVEITLQLLEWLK
jgi:hypothetical protein